jgi:hypothetical protein
MHSNKLSGLFGSNELRSDFDWFESELFLEFVKFWHIQNGLPKQLK